MELGNRIIRIRKEKNMTREDLAEAIGTSAPIVGRYERDNAIPSVEVALRIANALDVSLDFLVGNSSSVVKDKKMLYRIELLQKMQQQERERILYVLDTLLKDAQLSDTHKKLR